MNRIDPRWLILPLFIIVCGARTNAWQSVCDRVCLTRLADEYFSAIAAHDRRKAPLAPNVQFTEDSQVGTMGEGFWKSATKAPTALLR
jgi:hypothetical protein